MVSGSQKVFEGVQGVIMIMEAALISTNAENPACAQAVGVLNFNLSELRDDCNHGEPVHHWEKNSVKRQCCVF